MNEPEKVLCYLVLLIFSFCGSWVGVLGLRWSWLVLGWVRLAGLGVGLSGCSRSAGVRASGWFGRPVGLSVGCFLSVGCWFAGGWRLGSALSVAAAPVARSVLVSGLGGAGRLRWLGAFGLRAFSFLIP